MADIPFLDVGATYRELKAEIDAALARTLDSGWFILGHEITAFEKAFAAYLGAGRALGMGNGLDALALALRAKGIGPGDEVLVPSNTFIATWLAVSMAGAVPVPVEPVEATFNMDPDLLEAALTPRTRAVMPVHLYGQPADMDPINDFAEKHGLFVLEDAAQAQGARYKGRMAGTLGHAAGFSFYPGKNLGAFGDAGALATGDQELARIVDMLHNYGSKTKYVHEIQGVNSRLDDMQAAILSVKLRHLDKWNQRRRDLAALYLEELADIRELTLPHVPDWAEPVWHVFVVRTPRRDELAAHLAAKGIGTVIHYPTPPHRQGAYIETHGHLSLPISEAMHREVLSLPIGPHLDVEQARVVVATIRDFFHATP